MPRKGVELGSLKFSHHPLLPLILELKWTYFFVSFKIPNSGQLLKLEGKFTVYTLGIEKNALILANPCFGEKNVIFYVKLYIKII